ncbi:TPA: DNA primase [Escherichia coli]|nr:DNA primase [Escherichia coli]
MAAHISRRGDGNKELEEALDRIDMEAWLDAEGIDYKITRGSRGTQINVKECPCCGNSNWKVYLNADNGLGNCFHGDCEEKFNKWKFIRAHLGSASPAEVIEHIKTTAKEQGWKPTRTKATAVNDEATDLRLPESYAIPINGRNLKYLTNRGITPEMAQYFHLRFCHTGGFKYRFSGRDMVQDYSNRIIIPIYDMSGDLVSFQGRDITGTAEKKYLFPPGFASTGSILYNAHNVIGFEHVVMGEGVFDVMATKAAMDTDMGLRSIGQIGSFGKHLSNGDENSQLAKLLYLKEKGLKTITYMWDGEKKAIHDAIDSALIVCRYGLQVRVAILPDDKDPNEATVQEVLTAFRSAVTINKLSAAKLKLKLGL